MLDEQIEDDYCMGYSIPGVDIDTTRPYLPEELLFLSMIQRCMLDIEKSFYCQNAKEAAISAFRWITTERGNYLFSFRRICKHFGFNSEKLKNDILKKASSDVLDFKGRSL